MVNGLAGLKPLQGRRVLELCGLLPCPLMGLLLSDLGAEALKIEGPKGDLVCKVPPFAFGKGLMYHALNRGKATLTLDLSRADGRKRILDLVKTHDILLEGFRPGVMEAMGIGPEVLARTNPDLLIVRMSAFGQDADRPAHDLNLVGITGALGISDSMAPLPLQVADMTSAVLGALSVLAAVMEGRRGIIDLPLIMGAHLASFPLYTRFTQPGDLNTENLLLEGGYPLYRMYRTMDGHRVSIAAIEPKFVQRVMAVTGIQNPETQELSTWFKSHKLDEIIQAFSNTPACVEPVLQPWEAANHPAMKAMFAPLTDGDRTFLLPLTPFADPKTVPDGPWVTCEP